MNRTLHYLLLFVFIGLSGSALAQEILGTVVDSKNQPLTNASVQVKQGGISKGATITDFDGHYSVKPLEPGLYDVTVTFTGYGEKTVNGVIVSPGEKTESNFILEAGSKVLKTVTVYSKPLIDKYKTSQIMTTKEISQKPTTQTEDLVALTPGIYQAQRGGQVYSGGGRSTGNVYIIDGVQVQGTIGVDMSQNATEQLEVISSGIPANYGDVSGAVINITSRGVAQKFTGNVTLQHSIDGYNNNLASFSIAGPLVKRKAVDSITKRRESIMGFALSGDYYNDHDRYPSFYNSFVTKGNVLQQLQQNPLTATTSNSGQQIFNPSSAYITDNQLTTVKQPPHNVIQEGRLNGKVDLKITDQMHVTAGANIDYTSQDLYNSARNLFAPEATPRENTFAGRGFIRFTQKLGKQGAIVDTGKHSIISNAYYVVQVDYQKEYIINQDPKFKQNIFDYAYIGKFNKSYTDVYLPNQADSASGRMGTTLLFKAPTGITFNRSEMNPILANYTSEYYRLIGDNLPISTQQIQANNALMNGDEPASTYSLFYSPGSTQAGYSISNNNQYSLKVNAAFDLKAGGISHGIEFGLDYNQRIIKNFVANANINGTTASLWAQMRQLVSSVDNGNLKLDKTNPIFIVNGKHYTLAQVNAGVVRPSPTDTITYALINPVQTAFDKNLRAKLHLAANQDINIDALDPSTFSLSMFSADEILNSGNPFTTYSGYGYDGSAQTGTVNFNDFWTKKDANGNFLRPIAAFSPNMVSGYVLDKFEYKNILFNIGVRVERYSANTKVLKDPYSLYATRTVAQSKLVNTLNNGRTPSNISNSAVVYVDDNTSTSPTIIGYREGGNWYDPYGNAIADPSVLKAYSGGRDPQPYLQNNVSITDSNFNPNGSFTDYNPQVTVMPRIQVSFPISEASKFFAHYDIYSQRPYPTSLGYATAYDYSYLNQNSNQIINNANLRPQQTIDYEMGFEQLIGRKAVLRLTGFYTERKDMITVVPYLYAWPNTYYTYGNRDFSSTKGLKATYEMRATNHLSMTLNYTLQFAEGTGSDPFSTNSGGGGQISPNGLLQSFIEAGLPNLRYISPLSYDSRHNINASFDYRYGDGEGPVLFGNHIFQNAGLDLIAKTRSGEPYTRLENAIGNTIIGGINGSRLPWHFGVDLKLSKDFTLSIAHKAAGANTAAMKPAKIHKISAYLYIQNLLQTRDVLGVYGYTGKADDNGYLASPYGKAAIPVQINPQSYVDLYNIATKYGNLNYARTMNLGVSYNF